MSSLHEQAQLIADRTGEPAWVCRPVVGRSFVTGDAGAIPLVYESLQKVLPRQGYRSRWQPPGLMLRLEER